MSSSTTPVRTASSTFIAWLLLPTLIGYFLSPSGDEVPMPPVGEGCAAYAPTAEMITSFDSELVTDFTVTGNCCTSFAFTGLATGNSPTLTLTRGVTYTFTLTTGAAHPFAFRATAGGANIQGPFTADFTFTPDFVMPSNMVYQCAIHSPMLGNIILVNPNSPPSATNLSAPETFTEDVALNLTDIVVTDIDNPTTTATLTLSTPSAGSLNTGTSGPVTSTYNSGTGVWTASGLIASVNTLLAGLTFTPAANFSSNFNIATSVSDGIAAAVTGSKAITAIGVNDAPTLGNGALAAVNEDTSSPPGQSVSTIFTGQFADVDPGGSFGGIAVLGNTANAGTQGVWQYSTNAGANWFNIGTVNATAALVLSTATLVRFVPVLNFNGAPAVLSARGLDNTYAGSFSITAGPETRVLISTASSGGTTAISSAVASLSTAITAVNDAPQATNLSAAESYTEDVVLNLIDIVSSDVDNVSVTATLTLSSTAAGSLNTATSGAVTSSYNVGSGVWTASGAIANVNTLLAGLTFTPAANFNGAFTITTSVSDGVAAPAAGSKAMSGTAVNDAPILDAAASPTLSAVSEDALTPSGPVGSLVSVLVDLATPAGGLDNVTEVDAGALTGIAITAVAGSQGTWFFSTNGGANWVFLGPVSNSAALLLAADANARLYFQPDPDFNGPIANAVTFRAWDRTTGSNGSTANASLNGGITAFSSTTDVASITVSAVNDAPAATNLSASEAYTEDLALNLIDIVASDVDDANIAVMITLSNPAAGSLNTGTSGVVTSTFSAGVWSASGAIADVNALLAGLAFTPTLDFNNAFSIATGVSDGTAAPVTGSKAMTGTAINDAPTASNLSANESYTQDTPLDLVDIVVSDVDDVALTATLTLSNTAAGSLTTATSGAVTSTYTMGTGVWQASGAVADVNVLLGGLSYVPAPGFTSAFSISTEVSDGTATAITGGKAMTGIATTVKVSARVFLEGAYDAATGLMSDGLRSAGLVPSSEPFSGLGYIHVGGGGENTPPPVLAVTGINAVTDWVVLELRDMSVPATILASHSALVQRDGDVVDMDGVSPVSFSMPVGSYYVAVRHRNHLGCMTGAAVALSSSPASVDFTSAVSSLFGTGAVKSISGAFPAQVLWAGDVTFNGLVKYTGSANDRDPILVTVGSTTPNNVISNIYSTRDVNMNTEVKYTGSGNDRDPILVNVGSTTPNNTRLQQLP